MSNYQQHHNGAQGPHFSETNPYAAPPPKKPMGKGKKALLIIAAVIGALFVAALLIPNEPASNTNKPSVVTTVGTGPSPDPITTPTNKPVPPKPVVPKMTKSQEQAIGAAKDYLDLKGFSRKGLIDQLSSEYGSGFSKADATFAVDHIKVNWNEQAVRVAKAYLELSHFSRNGLIEQLESPYGDQFTHDQAVYGVGKAGL